MDSLVGTLEKFRVVFTVYNIFVRGPGNVYASRDVDRVTPLILVVAHPHPLHECLTAIPILWRDRFK